ncbi:MAG: glycosyltransferase family 39 protein [Candidatus Altiarchaeota archaeon]
MMFKGFSFESRVVVSLMSVALLLGLYLAATKPGVDEDSLSHLLPVHNLVAGRGYSYFGSPHLIMPPGYGLISYIAYLIVGDIEYSAVIVSVISYVLLIPATYYAGRRLFDWRAGLVSAFFVTFSPMLVYYSFLSFSDCLFCLFIMAELYTYSGILLEREGRLRRTITFGILTGFSYLIRPEGLILALMSFLFLFIVLLSEKKGSVRGFYSVFLESMRLPAVAFVLFILCAAPYVLFLHEHTGRWLLSSKMVFNLFWGETVVEGELNTIMKIADHPEYIHPRGGVGALEYLRDRNLKLLVRIRRNIVIIVGCAVAMDFHAVTALSMFTLFHILNSGWSGRRAPRPGLRGIKVAGSLLIFSVPMFSYVLFFVRQRFILPYTIVLLIPASYAIVRLWEGSMTQYGLGRSRIVLVVVLMVSLLPILGITGLQINNTIYNIISEPNPYHVMEKAGSWLRDNVEDPGSISVLMPKKGDVVLFYASGKKVPDGMFYDIHPRISMGNLSLMLENGTADYLILEEHYVRKMNHSTGVLWDNPETGGEYGMRLVHKDEGGLFQIYGPSKS